MASMVCPVCGTADSAVKRVVPNKSRSLIERKHQCNFCGEQYMTIEVAQPKNLLVVKHGGRVERFSWEKLWESISSTCKNLSITYDERRDIFMNVLYDITSKSAASKKSNIKSDRISDSVLNQLEPISKVAWIRFMVHYYDEERAIKAGIIKWTQG